MATPRDSHTANLLENGKVLVAGGYNSGVVLNSTELFDPATGTWTGGHSMMTPRYRHASTVLADGTVLVTGGQTSNASIGNETATAELYNPLTDSWTTVGPMTMPRAFHTSTLLPDGTVLITGGINASGVTLNSAEIYTPSSTPGAAGTFTPITAPMVAARNQHTATLLTSGNVLIAGGAASGGFLNSSELYNPLTQSFNATPQSFTQTASLITARDRSSARLLQNGKVLVEGGTTTAGNLASAEKFNEESGLTPTVPTATVATGVSFVVPGATGNTATCGGSTAQTGVSYAWTVLNGTITAGSGHLQHYIHRRQHPRRDRQLVLRGNQHLPAHSHGR